MAAIRVTRAAGLDLGQMQDFSALAVVDRIDDETEAFPQYQCRFLKRWPLQTPYPRIAEEVRRIMKAEIMREALLAVDQTGVGAPVVDLIREYTDVALVPIHITGGIQAHYDSEARRWTVPKKDLVGTLQVAYNSRRIKVIPCPEAQILVRELKNFKYRLHAGAAGGMQFDTWRDGQHDDLVLALALACWQVNRMSPLQETTEDNRSLVSQYMPRKELEYMEGTIPGKPPAW